MTELSKQANQLCQEIEKLPASEQQTNISTLAAELSRGVRQIIDANESAELIEKLSKFVKQHEDLIRTHHCGDLADKAERILKQYEHKTAQALRNAQSFRDKALLHFRALSMCLEMTGNAQTHGEKNARLRGALEVIEATIEKLEREDFDLRDFCTWHGLENGFIFRSDYPVRSLLTQIEELKAQLINKESTELTENEF